MSTTPNDTTQVDVSNPAELKRWCDELKTTDEALAAAVKAVGPRVDRIKDYLSGGQAGDQSGG